MNIEDIVDISQPIYDECPGNPAFPKPRIRVAMEHKKEGWRTEHFDYYNHIGTHIDAPFHRFQDGKKIDEMQPELFTGPAIPVDLYDKKEKEPITVDDLLPYEHILKEGDILLFCTGWGELRSDSDRYLNRSPYLSPDAARWCVARKVRGVGIDHFSIGGTESDIVGVVHEILLSGKVWIAEECFFPKKILRKNKWTFIGFPILLKGGSGAPVRAVLIDEGMKGERQ